MNKRRNSKEVKIGSISIGGGARISVQSMTNTAPLAFEATKKQIDDLAAAGCNIVRISAPVKESADIIYRLKESGVTIPLVSDIHFDYRIALRCIEAGVDKIRINPGNIGDNSHVKEVVDACRIKNIPIRVGVNSGSLEKNILAKYGSPTPEALVESALYHVNLIEEYGYDNIVISIKASSVNGTIAANRILASRCGYPLHIGVTEAGTEHMAIIKSAMGIGSLLCDGIGDTVRVSVTGDPVKEVYAAKDILKAAGIFREGDIDIVSCPTCGRTRIDIIRISEEFEKRAKKEIKNKTPLKIAIMGCVVNGPGEASEADYGVAGGDGEAIVFRHGKILRKVPENQIINCLIEEINKNTSNNGENL